MNLLGTYLPDYCNGNLYSLRPSVGLALAEGARSVFHHYHAEDLFITGLVAEQLPAVSLKSLSHLGPSQLWDGVLAHCPLIGFLRWGLAKVDHRPREKKKFYHHFSTVKYSYLPKDTFKKLC